VHAIPVDALMLLESALIVVIEASGTSDLSPISRRKESPWPRPWRPQQVRGPQPLEGNPKTGFGQAHFQTTPAPRMASKWKAEVAGMRNAYEQERRALSIEEAARSCGLSRSTLYRLLKNGKLPTVKIGARRLVPVAAIDALLSGGAQ